MRNSALNKLYRAAFPQKNPALVKKRFQLPDSLNLNFKFSQDGWFVVTSPDLPGFITQANSKDELIEMVNDAVLTYFDVPRREGDIVYNRLKLGGETIQYTGELVTQAA